MMPINKEQEALRLYRDLCKWFDSSTYGIGFTLQKYPPLKLWDSYQLHIDAGNNLEPGKHIGGVYNSKTQAICIEWKLPRVIFLASAAHELAHAWQDQQGVLSKQVPWRSEGFAEWVAYVYLERMLSSFTDPAEKKVATYYMDTLLKMNPDPIYGEGLREFLKTGTSVARERIKIMALQTDKP
jgi:hypothetical protein